MHVMEMKILRRALNITRLDHVTNNNGSGTDPGPGQSTTTTAPVVWTRQTQLGGHRVQSSDADRSGWEKTTKATEEAVA